MKAFRCPRCGAACFGAVLNRELEIIAYECHGDGSAAPDRSCDWTGPAEACLIELADEDSQGEIR